MNGRARLSAVALALVSACASTPADPDAPGAPGDPPRPGARRPDDVKPCYTPESEALPATAEFWTALGAEDRAARPAAISALQAAAKAHPAEEQIALLLGLAQLWRVAAPTEAEQKDGLGLILAATASRNQLERAYELCPADHRIPAWLGPILVNTGWRLKDQKAVEQGLAILQRGIDHYPAFVLFSRLLIYADRPAADPDFQNALRALRDNVDVCGDIRTATDPACINSPRAPHNIEGSSLFLGDVLAKAGLRDEALRAYRDGQALPSHDGWPYQALLRERIATVDERVRAYQEPDPAKAPPSIWGAREQCAVCHQK